MRGKLRLRGRLLLANYGMYFRKTYIAVFAGPSNS